MKRLNLVLLFAFYFAIGFSYTYLNKPKIASMYWGASNVLSSNASWFIPLQQEFKKHGYLLDTSDKHPIETADLVLITRPEFSGPYPKTKQLYIWTRETPLVQVQPLPKHKHTRAKKILTWRQDLVDNTKTFYVPCGMLLRAPLKPNPAAQTVLVAQVSTNHVYKTYQERRNAVLWFLKNHPTDLEFYGNYWDKIRPTLSAAEQKAFDRQYKGYTPDKLAVLNKARFTLTYENMQHPDYVSEKIYDVLLAGSVPIYLGAQNIDRYVPKDCFIDKRDFPEYATLYTFLKNMPEAEYQKYLDCAGRFLSSDTAQQLTGPLFAQRIADIIFK